VMYVWFDALIFYISNIGWPHAMKEFEQWWPVVQIAGKDNLRQQSAIWQAMLMSAGIQNSKQIIIHGFITSNGKKMSKSLGNVVDPFKLINKYGVDPVRYYLLKEIPSVEDGDYSDNRMKEIYNSDLANELGNLVSRITTLAEKDKLTISNQDASIFNKQQGTLFEAFDFNTILDSIWVGIKDINKKVNDFAPWNKSSDDRKEFLENMVRKLHVIGQQLLPFIPTTSEKIIASTQGNITKAPPLFPRLK
ncbi:methionine--tRNA ligase, partial [Candidatus Roizmanbacteria bacterium CG_4_10_14_0_8_um_filter_39_9]